MNRVPRVLRLVSIAKGAIRVLGRECRHVALAEWCNSLERTVVSTVIAYRAHVITDASSQLSESTCFKANE